MKVKNTERWRKTSIKAGDVRDDPYDPLRITISEQQPGTTWGHRAQYAEGDFKKTSSTGKAAVQSARTQQQ